MHRALKGLIALGWAAALHAQAAPQQPAQGLQTDWDIGIILGEISAHAGRVADFLDRVDAKSWAEKGASETYAAQVESSRQQARAIEAEAKTLARNPEKLSQSLQLYFRLDAVDTMLGSIEGALRKYRGPQDGQALASLAAEGGVNGERFRRYIVNLASEREREMEVMDREAQRCRGMVAAPQPARAQGRKK